MTMYRKRVLVGAEQFWPDDKPWPDGVTEFGYQWGVRDEDCHRLYSVRSEVGSVLGGNLKPGDWVVTNPNGQRYAVPDAVFRATYEEAVDA